MDESTVAIRMRRTNNIKELIDKLKKNDCLSDWLINQT